MNLANSSKNIFNIILFFSLFSVSLISKAEEYVGFYTISNKNFTDLKIVGKSELSLIEADEINIIGPLNFDGLTVRNAQVIGNVRGKHGKFEVFQLTGKANLKECKVNSLDVTGNLQAEGLKVKDDLNVIGNLKLKNSIISKINITSNSIYLKNSACDKIVVKTNDSSLIKDKLQILKLKNSNINGDVIFESKQGQIHKDKSSKIIGKVSGAKIVSEE